jgi:hypothetical protein
MKDHFLLVSFLNSLATFESFVSTDEQYLSPSILYPLRRIAITWNQSGFHAIVIISFSELITRRSQVLGASSLGSHIC